MGNWDEARKSRLALPALDACERIIQEAEKNHLELDDHVWLTLRHVKEIKIRLDALNSIERILNGKNNQ